ncbi:MAG TPA: non-canonical purine NTP pyrophosphatase [Acetobacteraceae bacterium]
MQRRLPPGSTLVIATHNAGKLREIAALLRPLGINAVSAGGLGLPEPVEDAPDFAGNAALKALAAARASGLPSLADDSGFCAAALGGAPGVVSARWAGPDKDFAVAMERVWREMAGSTDRRAWFMCALCMAWPDGHAATYLGRVEGMVVWPPRGTLGFGYDPMFAPLGGTQTYGETDPAAKHATSHRARAMAQLMLACFGTM